MARAQDHWRRAVEIKEERLANGGSMREALEGSRWHQRRAWGQIERFEHVYDCGARKYWLICERCTEATERTQTCRVALVCRTCRDAVGQEKRAKFRLARNRALDRARAADLFDRFRAGGRWTEKLLTLTIPHYPEHDVATRIELAFAAWSRLRDSLKKHFALIAAPNERRVAWFRAFEWTPGNDLKGHPHFHIWWLSPYVDRERIVHWWRCALMTAGFAKDALLHLIIDLREVRDGEGAVHEVIKYLTKDVLPDRSLVPPDIFARVYESLDGRRITRSSAGFFKNITPLAECKCGAIGCFRRSSTPPESKVGTAANV